MPKSPGKFLLRVTLGQLKSADGKAKRVIVSETFEGSRADAEKALTAKLARMDVKPLQRVSRLSVGAACERWLMLRVNIADRTRYNYRAQIEAYILKEVISGVPLAKLTRPLVQQWIAALSEKYAATTVRQAVIVLKQVCSNAVQDGTIPFNPCDHVELPRIERVGSPAVLSVADMERLMSACYYDKHGPLFVILLLSGLRPQEALALTWDDVTTMRNPEDGVDYPALRVTKALTMSARSSYSVGPVKTPTSRRVVPLPMSAKGVFSLLRSRSPHAQATDYLFPRDSGGFQLPDTIYDAWRRVLDRNGFPPMKLYATRHSNISALLAGNVHPKVASERAGHSTTTVTLDVYSHVSPSMQASALRALPILSPPAEEASS